MKATAEEFVRAWQAAASCKEVAEQLQTSLSSVSSRAALYRKKGVRLKIFPPRPPLNVDALNALIDANGQEPAPKKRTRSAD